MNRNAIKRRRGSRSVLIPALLYAALLVAVAGGTSQFLRLLTVHLLIFLGAFLLILAAVAQFVLPVRGQPDRMAVIARLLNYLLGERGTVTFIKDGRPRAATGERQTRGPGVIWVDHLSAGVLRTDADLTRSIGPGELAFTEPGEWLAEGLDLRRQRSKTRTTGNEVGGLALTRDGIPVSASLSVTFMLDRRSQIKRGSVADPPPITPSPGALQGAVYGRVVADEEGLSWSDIPLPLMVELWREYVKERTLNELLEDQPRVLAEIEDKILARLDPDPDHQGSSPDQRMLRERGIRILGVAIDDFRLPEEIQEERLQAWFDTWAGPVRRELSDADAMVRSAGRHGEALASARLATRLTHKLRQQIRLQPGLGQRDSIILLLEDAAEFAAEEPRLAQLSNRVRDVLDQVKARSADCT
jgi:hypothetical protein